MEQATIARSYASALFELAGRGRDYEAYARAFATVNALLDGDRRVRDFLRSPKIDVAAKKQALQSAFQGRVPPLFLNFLLVVLDKRRQRLLKYIAREYDQFMDEKLGRLNMQVTLAHTPDARELAEISARLSRLTGKSVIPHVHVDPAILGGIIVRYGDRLLDGSIRRRLLSLRGRLLETSLAAPNTPPATRG
jgi:F-type H+-transporting ATPase subunit delta